MTPPDPQPNDTPIAALQTTVQGGATLNWLVGIFLLCLLLVFGLRGHFTALELDIGQQGAGELSQQMADRAMLLDLQGLEKALYLMALTQTAEELASQKAHINTRIDKVRHHLALRDQVGTTPTPPDQGPALTNLTIQLDQLQDLTLALVQVLPQRWQNLAAGGPTASLDAEKAIARAVKPLTPAFEGLNVRLSQFAQAGEQRLKVRQDELQNRAAELKTIETGLIVFVVLLGGVAGLALMRHLSAALKKAQVTGLAIARQREQNASILNTLSDGVYTTNLQGDVTFINAAGEHILGWPDTDLVGQAAHQAIHHSHPDGSPFPREQCPLMAVLLDGVALDSQAHFVHRDGAFIPVAYRAKPLTQDGVSVGSLVSFHDITQELATRTRLKLVESAIQDIEQGIFITDATAHAMGPTLADVNAGFCHMLGFTSQEAVGLRVGTLCSPDTDPEKLAHIQTSMAQGDSLILEMAFQRKDGSPLATELHLSPVHNDLAVVTHYIGVLTDISVRQKAELALRNARDQALENSRLKSEFLSNMSHEIRTPMNGIIGMTGLLLDTRLDAEQRDFTQIVRDSAQALLVIINDILDFSKIEAGKLDVEITDFSPLEVVEGTTELLLAKAREKSLWLTSFVDPSIPALMQGDPTRLRQVMLNLISNAIKFTEQGGIELNAQHVNIDGQPMVRFEVRDTGIGISPAVQARLFTSFTQADSSTTRKYGGTGLGLAISRSLVELMGGQIGIHSQLGEGSTFWFTLPLQHAKVSTDLPHIALAATESTGMRVLVVDDQAIDRKIIGRYLDSWRMTSHSAPNAAQALKQLGDAADSGQAFDAALIDLVMPGMDGLELARALRADHRFDKLRLVLLTGHDRRNLAEQATQAGFFACLTKPVRQSQLFDSLTVQAVNPPSGSRPTPHAQSSPANPLARHHRILLAEDNLINQKVAQLQIGKLGYTLHTVNNGQEALAAMAAVSSGQGTAYAVILMDCQMPIMDGFEATAAIRLAQLPGERRVPIIAMTAHAMQGDRERCLVAGMDDYLSKPIDPTQLREVLSRWIDLAPDTPPLWATPATASDALASEFNQTLINFELLADYFGDEPEAISRLLTLFEATSGVLLKKLGKAVEARDTATVGAVAHELKGSCGNIGVERMAHIANALENAALAQQWAEADSLQTHLALAFKATILARTGT